MVSIIPDTFRFIFFHSLTGPVSLKTVPHIVYTLGVNFQRGILLINLYLPAFSINADYLVFIYIRIGGYQAEIFFSV